LDDDNATVQMFSGLPGVNIELPQSK